MAKESVHKKLERVRPPRVHVTYDVEVGDAIEVKEGVEEGDLVVVDIEQELKDKTKVEITETQEGIF